MPESLPLLVEVLRVGIEHIPVEPR